MEEKIEKYNLDSSELVSKVKEIIKEGNARRIIIKNQDSQSIMEIPLTIGIIGVMAAPYLSAVGALTAVLTSCSIEVQRK